MVTVCKCAQCGYNADGYCARTVITIDNSGMCNKIWKNGIIRRDAFAVVDGIEKSIATDDADFIEVQEEVK